MNEYLAKLHSLESAASEPRANKSIVEAPTKPTDQVVSGFVSDQSVSFFSAEAEARKNTATPHMQNVIPLDQKKHSHDNRQNRQNLVAASFPAEALSGACAQCGQPGGGLCGYDGVMVTLHLACRDAWRTAYDAAHPLSTRPA